METQFPHTITTITGEKLTFLGISTKNGIDFLEIENEVQPNAGPPMHVHYKQEECLTIVNGKMGYQELGGEEKYAGPGETLLFKAGITHKFWNAGSDVLKCTGYVSPPESLVYFLSEIYKSVNENGGKPGIFDSAFLLTRYKSEFGMNEIPVFVQNILFPVILFLGKMTGKYKKYSEAP